MITTKEQLEIITRAISGALYSIQNGGSFSLEPNYDVTKTFVKKINLRIYKEKSNETENAIPLYELEHEPDVDIHLMFATNGSSLISKFVTYFEIKMHEMSEKLNIGVYE